jgi:hypothetical protein
MPISRVLPLAIVFALAAAIAGCATTHPAGVAKADAWSHYGAMDPEGTESALEKQAVSVADLRRAAARGRPIYGDVVLSGVIRGVCQTKGCWMTMTDAGAEPVFVKFRDYSFFVPRNAIGRKAVIRGTPIVNTVSVAMLRHYAEDARKSPAEVAAITSPETRIEFIADSVWIQGRGLVPPYEPSEQESCEEPAESSPEATAAPADAAPPEEAPTPMDTAPAAPVVDLP